MLGAKTILGSVFNDWTDVGEYQSVINKLTALKFNALRRKRPNSTGIYRTEPIESGQIHMWFKFS